MILVKHGAFGDTPNEREVAWPSNWRIPQAGDIVSFEPGWGGFVEWADFSPVEGVIRIRLR